MIDTIFWTAYVSAVVVGLGSAAFYGGELRSLRRDKDDLREALEMSVTMSESALVHTVRLTAPRHNVHIAADSFIEVKFLKPGLLVDNGVLEVSL